MIISDMYSPIKTGLRHRGIRVVVGTDLEDEVAPVVGCDLDLEIYGRP